MHHDNAPAHKAKRTQDFLAQERLQQVDHPTYSPDLAPRDFFVFPQVKKQLRGVRFESAEAAVQAFIQHVQGIPVSEWSTCFEEWFQRMQKYIDSAGEYFEKM